MDECFVFGGGSGGSKKKLIAERTFVEEIFIEGDKLLTFSTGYEYDIIFVEFENLSLRNNGSAATSHAIAAASMYGNIESFYLQPGASTLVEYRKYMFIPTRRDGYALPTASATATSNESVIGFGTGMLKVVDGSGYPVCISGTIKIYGVKF